MIANIIATCSSFVLMALSGSAVQVETAIDQSFGKLYSARFGLDANSLIVGNGKGEIGYLNLKTKMETKRAGHAQAITGIFLVQDGKGQLIYTFGADGFGLEYDAKDLAIKNKTECHACSINAADVTSDGKMAVTAGTDKKIRIWNTKTWQLHSELIGSKDHLRALCLSSDGKRVFSGHKDGQVCVWNVDNKEMICAMGSHDKDVVGMALSKDNAKLISVGLDGVIRVWDTKKHICLAKMREGKDDLLTCVCFVKAEKYVAVGCGSGNVEVWDIEKKMARKVFRGADRFPWALALSPDGKSLLVLSVSGKIKIFTEFCN